MAIWFLDAEFRQLYLLGPGERFQLIGGPHPDHPLTSLQIAPNGSLYSVSNVTDSLYRLDTNTGVASFVGAIGVGVGWGGLAIAPDGRAWTPDVTGSVLHELNLSTGESVYYQGYGPMQLRGLAWRSDDVLVGLDTRWSNSLLEIGPTIGVRTLASLPTLVGRNGGLAIDGNEGFFATGGTGVGGSHKLFEFDPFTGEIWFVRNLPPRFANRGTVGIALLPKHKPGRPSGPPRMSR